MTNAERCQNYYQRNKARLNVQSATRRRRHREMVDELKREPCMDCGGRFDPVCMDFDHRPGEAKVAEVSVVLGWAKDRLLAEIAKCDLVCANCHRLRTKMRAPLVTAADAIADLEGEDE